MKIALVVLVVLVALGLGLVLGGTFFPSKPQAQLEPLSSTFDKVASGPGNLSIYPTTEGIVVEFPLIGWNQYKQIFRIVTSNGNETPSVKRVLWETMEEWATEQTIPIPAYDYKFVYILFGR
jgi:hypothetical protein